MSTDGLIITEMPTLGYASSSQWDREVPQCARD
jgi:hypothetical protein